MSEEVKKIILNSFKTGIPQLSSVASKLNLTERTVQRKLREEKVTYSQIVEDVKKELAIDLICSEKLTINEISYSLKYSDPAVFRRAFKKWTGKSAIEFKKSRNKLS